MQIARSSGLALLGLAACRPSPSPKSPDAHASAAGFEWSVPPGWKSETIPFPIDFAPTLAYRGTEEVRFAPRFFDPKADSYFSYSFAWILDLESPIAPERLGGDLEVYFYGLAQAVGAEKHAAYDRSLFAAHVEAPEVDHYRGIVKAVDPFGDGHALVLLLDAETRTCGTKRVLLVTLSPQASAPAIATMLLDQRRTFRCTA